MQYKSAAIIVAGLAAQQAIADDWQHAGSYSCPGNTNNHCSSHQKGGYDWSGLQPGSFSSYGSNSFHGFSCSNSFGKRDLLGKRGFQSKCITGNLDDGPSMSCDSGDTISIDQIQVSTSHDADVDCEYGMPDGSTCHQTHSCSEGGSIFQNTQCGGAKSVTFKPGNNAPPGCSIGVHSIGFHCGHASSTVPVYSTSATAVVSSSAVASSAPCYGSGCAGTSSSVAAVSSSSPAASSSLPCYGAGCGETSSSVAAASSSSAPAVGSSSAPCYGSGCGETSSSVSPASSSAPAVGSSSLPCYGSGCETSSSVSPASSSAPAVGSSSAPCYGAGCSSPSASSAPAAGSSSLPCYGSGCGETSSSVAAASSSVAVGSSSATSPGGGYPTPHCPGLLPKCLNTWMWMSHCEDNADSNCFCGSEKFIKNVMGCLEAWGASESETQAAASYLMGLCAPHVTTNPAIITACPSTVKPTATPAGYTHPHGKPSKPVSPITSKPAGKPAPVTTITYSSTVTVPCTYETGVSKGLTISHSSSETTLVTTVTVPQVHLTTSTVTVAGTTTCSVGLGGGPSPASASAYATSSAAAVSAPAAPTGTTFSTGWGAKPTGSSAPIAPATGAGAKVGSGIAGVILGVVVILAAF